MIAYRLLALSSLALVLNSAGMPSYTIHLREVMLEPGGQRRIVSEKVIARRTDGTRVELIRFAPGTTRERTQRTIHFPNLQQILALDTEGVKRTSSPAPPEIAAHFPNNIPTGASSCLSRPNGELALIGYRVESRESIRGVSTVKLVRGEMTAWHAVDYACEEVQRPVSHQFSGIELLSLHPGEPSAHWFDTSKLRESGGSGR